MQIFFLFLGVSCLVLVSIFLRFSIHLSQFIVRTSWDCLVMIKCIAIDTRQTPLRTKANPNANPVCNLRMLTLVFKSTSVLQRWNETFGGFGVCLFR